MIEGHGAAFAAAWNESAVVRAYLGAVERELLAQGGVGTAQHIARPWCSGDSRRVHADLFAGSTLDGDRPGVTDTDIDLTALEEQFVAVAYHYGAQRGICYAAWRVVGVDPAVLGRAGIRATT